MRLIDKVIVILFARLYSIVTKHSFITQLFDMGLSRNYSYLDSPHLQGGMTFATQISPLLNYSF